eukprot:TRINITY_DN28760_c0_g5_i2.p1 TRINITY_DN28760_c0_g5~~TRINITY_DN28760_c0_g5_i2.p1  ORF type:complete len:278 (-),score=68.32 TRINITY_DN28760_c0_g5_i2:142-975(-)
MKIVALLILSTLQFAYIAAQVDSVYIRAQALGVKQDDKAVKTAESFANAKVADPMGAAQTVATSQAQADAPATANSLATTRIQAATTGNGNGRSSASAASKATAESIATAIARALGEVEGVITAEALVQATRSVAQAAIAETSSEVELSGNALAASETLAQQSVFVQTAAQALSQAGAAFDGVNGTAGAQVGAAAARMNTTNAPESITDVKTYVYAGENGQATATNSAAANYVELEVEDVVLPEQPIITQQDRVINIGQEEEPKSKFHILQRLFGGN